MSEYTITDVELAKELPDYKGGGAKVFRLSLMEDDRKPELFVMDTATPPEVGEKVDGEITPSDYGPKFTKSGGSRKGGGGRSPADTKAIQRQHSQEMANQKQMAVIAKGGPLWNGDQLRSVINWYEEDIAGKNRGITWDGFSDDVPGDLSDPPLQGRVEFP